MSDITGRRLAFPPRLGDRNHFVLVEDDANIRQSIYVIIYTVPGERVMRPEFGCQIHDLIFWPVNLHTAAIAERYVQEALERWEPRITLEKVDVSVGDHDHGQLVINIAYKLKDQHDSRSLVYPYYLLPEAE